MNQEIDQVIHHLVQRREPVDRHRIEQFVNHYKHLDELLSNAPECHYLIDFSKVSYEYISDNVESITGYSKEEMEHQGNEPLIRLLPRHVKEIFVNKVYRDSLDFFQQYEAEELKTFTIQKTFPIRTKNGEEIFVLDQTQFLMVAEDKRPLLSFGRFTKIAVPETHNYLSYGIHQVDHGESRLIFQRFYGVAEHPEVSGREKEILKNLVRGLSSKEIGDRLHISMNTVNNHRRNLLSKLGFQNTADLVRYALTNAIY